MDDLTIILAIAKSHASNGKPPKYMSALEMAYARTIAYMSENWMPKPQKVITLTPADAENRIHHD